MLGFLFFVHGSQLMLGWFGGFGLSGSMQFFTQKLGIPAAFAFLAIATQFFGGILLILGLAGRLAALTIVGDMVVAVAKVHWQFGLFMNWYGMQKGEGFEYHLPVSYTHLDVYKRQVQCRSAVSQMSIPTVKQSRPDSDAGNATELKEQRYLC